VRRQLWRTEDDSDWRYLGRILLTLLVGEALDKIDCASKTATMNYWMYNAMSKRSFGRFASHPAFALSRMAT
jgi:hypothetical protein